MNSTIGSSVDTSLEEHNNSTTNNNNNNNNSGRRPRVKRKPDTNSKEHNENTKPTPTVQKADQTIELIQKQLKEMQEKLDTIEIPEHLQRVHQKVSYLEKQQQTQQITVRLCYDMMFIMFAVIGALFVTVCYLVYKYVYPAWSEGRLDLSLFIRDPEPKETTQPGEIHKGERHPTPIPTPRKEVDVNSTPSRQPSQKHPSPKGTPSTVGAPMVTVTKTPIPQPKPTIPPLDLNKLQEHIKAPNPFVSQKS